MMEAAGIAVRVDGSLALGPPVGQPGWQKAVVAMANKNAQILWAVLAKGQRFGPDYVSKPGGAVAAAR